MPKSKPPYPAPFRQQMVELVQAGRTPAQLAREFRDDSERGDRLLCKQTLARDDPMIPRTHKWQSSS